jgi:hypothetical protein
VPERELYLSANGDRWLLARDPASARVFVIQPKLLRVADPPRSRSVPSSMRRAEPPRKENFSLIGTLVAEADDSPE